MTKRRLLTVALFLLLSGVLFAGDIATFVNLGFSPDSRILAFAQYGVERGTSRPFAELYLVDVHQNRFVPDGVRRMVFDVPVRAGQDGSGALYALMLDNAELLRRHTINPLSQGRMVYLLINGETPRSEITFRDFSNSNRYTVGISQRQRRAGTRTDAAFHLTVSNTPAAGTPQQFTVGLPDFFREGVTSYQIGQAYVSPDERSLVFVVERVTDAPSGRTVRYMVETVRVVP